MPHSVSPANAKVLNPLFQFNTPSNTETHASKNPTSLSMHWTKVEFEIFFLPLTLYSARSEMKLSMVLRMSPLPRNQFAIITNTPRGQRAMVRGNAVKQLIASEPTNYPLIRPVGHLLPLPGGEGTCGTLIWKGFILDRAKYMAAAEQSVVH